MRIACPWIILVLDPITLLSTGRIMHIIISSILTRIPMHMRMRTYISNTINITLNTLLDSLLKLDRSHSRSNMRIIISTTGEASSGYLRLRLFRRTPLGMRFQPRWRAQRVLLVRQQILAMQAMGN